VTLPVPLVSPDTPAPLVPLRSAPLPVPPVRSAAPGAERRQLTVLFCDMVDSTTLAGRLDPEDFHDVLGRYHAVCTTVIQRYGGHIAQ
jgi:class 3 adenylate cyclase